MLSPHFIRYMTVIYKNSVDQRVVNDTTYCHTWDSALQARQHLLLDTTRTRNTDTVCGCIFLCRHDTEQQPQRRQ